MEEHTWGKGKHGIGRISDSCWVGSETTRELKLERKTEMEDGSALGKQLEMQGPQYH